MNARVSHEKTKVAILGSGNIGTDELIKLRRSADRVRRDQCARSPGERRQTRAVRQALRGHDAGCAWAVRCANSKRWSALTVNGRKSGQLWGPGDDPDRCRYQPGTACGVRGNRREYGQQECRPGTRQNIDEFTQTTARGLERVGARVRAKRSLCSTPPNRPS